MAYTKYSLTPADNNAAPPNGAPEGMLPSAVNDTMRDMMAQIRDVGDGIRGGTYTMTAPIITGGSITGVALTGNTFTSPVISGGSINNTPIGATTASTGAFSTLSVTGATTFSGAMVANTFSSSGATITGGSISGITDLAVADGGTGASTLAANNVLLGNGTSALQTVAPSTNGNFLRSNGTTWISEAVSVGGGTVTSVATGNGLSGGAITSTGTLVIACPTFDSVGSYAMCGSMSGFNSAFTAGSNYAAGGTSDTLAPVCLDFDGASSATVTGVTSGSLSGTWKWMSATISSNTYIAGIACRVS
jgi:hypothetical protein